MVPAGRGGRHGGLSRLRSRAFSAANARQDRARGLVPARRRRRRVHDHDDLAQRPRAVERAPARSAGDGRRVPQGSRRRAEHVSVPGTAVYLSIIPELIPGALRHNFDHNRVLHERIVLLTIVTEEVPHVAREGTRRSSSRSTNVSTGSFFTTATWRSPTCRRLSEASRRPAFVCDPGKTSYFLGKESILPPENRPGMALWREKLFALMTRNAFSAMRSFGLPPEQSIEIRGQIEI